MMTTWNTLARNAAAGLLLAGTVMGAAQVAIAQTPFADVERTGDPQIRFAAAERGQPILAGGEVSVSGEGFRPNQRVTLLHGTTPLPGGTLTADAEGKVEGRIAIPASAAAGNHPILFVAQGPYHAGVANLKVSPTVPLSGERDFTVTRAQAARGLYQSAYSAKNNALFVTSAVGRPPVRQSELQKLDPDTLRVTASITPAAAPAPERRPAPAGAPAGRPAAPGGDGGPGVFAVYGVDVDDAKDTVWVTNTRQNTVAVYRQSDLSLVKQFAPGTVTHARDVRVDATLGKAYAGATTTNEIVVFDTATNEVARRITVPAAGRGQQFNVASLSLDPQAHRLYVASLSTNEVAVIDTRTDQVVKTMPVPGARDAIGIGHDPQTGRIFVASQGSDNLVVLDGNDGSVIADTPVGADALNVVFDPVKRRAYVANRGAGTVTVTDADGRIVANLGPAPLANHVALGRDGTVFAVDKSSGANETAGDTVLRIRPRR